MRRLALFYSFANLFNVWLLIGDNWVLMPALNSIYYDMLFCFKFFKGNISHRYVVGKQKNLKIP